MPLLVRVFVRTALLYLLASALLGGALLAAQGLGVGGAIRAFQPLFYHLLMVGWASQLIGGVALWMFPVASRERPRGDDRLGWAAYGGLNAGLLLRALAEPAHTLGQRGWTGPALVASALLQAAAVWLLVAALWPRVKGKPAR
ncbi:MAG TPA: hypothetical protein VFS21_14540 [Roseiflexaceae bacterium]|nr:hypothetical protein [Roseiflexaceae bacterium]